MKLVSSVEKSIVEDETSTNIIDKKLTTVNIPKKISHNLVYEPIIAFYHHDYPNLTNSIELGVLKCVLNKKGDFQYYYINLMSTEK